MPAPAEELCGLVLEGGWKVISKVERPLKATGGCFSCGYIVESENNRGYLKALDYSSALESPNPAIVLQAMTEAYNFELVLCEKIMESNQKKTWVNVK